jgi:hypothetical protein
MKTDKQLLDETFSLLKETVNLLIDREKYELLKKFAILEQEFADNAKVQAKANEVKPDLLGKKVDKGVTIVASGGTAAVSSDIKTVIPKPTGRPDPEKVNAMPWDTTPNNPKQPLRDPLRNIGMRENFDDLPDPPNTKVPNPPINDLPWDEDGNDKHIASPPNKPIKPNNPAKTETNIFDKPTIEPF